MSLDAQPPGGTRAFHASSSATALFSVSSSPAASSAFALVRISSSMAGPSYMPETVESSNFAFSSVSVLRAVSRMAETTRAASRFL